MNTNTKMVRVRGLSKKDWTVMGYICAFWFLVFMLVSRLPGWGSGMIMTGAMFMCLAIVFFGKGYQPPETTEDDDT